MEHHATNLGTNLDDHFSALRFHRRSFSFPFLYLNSIGEFFKDSCFPLEFLAMYFLLLICTLAFWFLLIPNFSDISFLDLWRFLFPRHGLGFACKRASTVYMFVMGNHVGHEGTA